MENLFASLQHHISVKGVITGGLPGNVILSDDHASAVVTSPQGIFVGGNPDNALFFQKINTLLKEVWLPGRASKGKRDYVLFYPSDADWSDSLAVMTDGLYPMRSGRMTYTHDLCGSDGSDALLGKSIVPVDLCLLTRQDLAGLDGIKNEILDAWPSLEAFADKGFGCVAIHNTDVGEAIISWCLTDWVIGDECEFGIETDDGYRRQGWARKVALGALSLASQRGIKRVGWQCWSSNAGSQRTALSAGFKFLADFPVLFGWNLPLNNFLVNGNHYMRGDLQYGVAKDYSRAAWSYAQALDQGWDWNGDAALYWNAACLFYLTGEKERAKHYYRLAVARGWKDIYQPHYHEYVYREADSERIACLLAGTEND